MYNKKTATLLARQSLQNEIRTLEAQLDSNLGTSKAEFGSQKRISRTNLAKRLQQKKDTLERVSPPQLVDIQKNKMNSRLKDLEKEIGGAMIPRDKMMGERMSTGGRAPYPGMVAREMEFQRKYGDKIREAKEIARRIAPDNPILPNLERLRPEH